MFRKITMLCLILSFCPMLLFSQGKAILKPGGKTIYVNSNVDPKEEISRSIDKKRAKLMQKSFSSQAPKNVTGTLDTLKWEGEWSTTYFGVYGQDVFAQWYVAPTELVIKSVGFDVGDNDQGISGEVKLYKIGNGWTKEMLQKTGDNNIGYWISANGSNDIAPFEDEATEPKTWVAHGADEYSVTPFAEDIWSDNGVGAPIVLVPDGDTETYQWVEMNQLTEPTIQAGEIFAVVLKNSEPVSNLTDRFGFPQDNSLQYGLLKFHATPRTAGDTSTAGWWMRATMLNWAVIVDLIGDAPPTIEDITVLPTTLSQEDRTVEAKVTDTNPSGGAIGVQSVTLQYKINDSETWTDVAMTASGDIYSGVIPGQVPGTDVTYRVKASDVQGNESVSEKEYFYKIFQPQYANLLVFSGFDTPTGYPQEYYFGHDDFENYSVIEWKHDVWSYGPLTAELVNNYANIFEISSISPTDYNDDVIRTWLEGSASRNYFLAGQEWLGARYEYADKDFAAGTFEYDILGITHSYNDISYDGTAGQELPSRLFAQENSLLGDSLFKKFTALNTDSLQYDINGELGVSGQNWIDGYDVIDGIEVDVKVESRGIAGAPSVGTYNTAHHRTLTAGNKIAFAAFDPISVNTSPEYYWFGFSTVALQVQALRWFDIATAVDDQKLTPNEYKLAQNYPNPFNPSTSIKFSLLQSGNVSLKVYDMLGREVASLLNGFKNAGVHEVKFDASNLTSGMYIYTIKSGNFTSTKKMMLLK